MKIPSKTDKRTYNKLLKRAAKNLRLAINNQQSDMLVEAEYCMEHFNPDSRASVVVAANFKETQDYWHKDVKAEFREFLSTKRKLIKALAKYEQGKKK